MVIVITGATKGIGREIAGCLAEKGHRMVLCARSASDLESLRDELSDRLPRKNIMIQAMDLRDRSSIAGFAGQVLDEFGYIDVLINNAGVFIPGTILEESADTFDMVMETNLHGAYFLAKAFLPAMIKRHDGHVINICSVASMNGYPNGGSYVISKHALHGFGKALREEVRKFGIRVTNVLPGATWTNSWEGVDLPEHRLMQAKNIASIVRTAIELDSNAVMEEVVVRPIERDL